MAGARLSAATLMAATGDLEMSTFRRVSHCQAQGHLSNPVTSCEVYKPTRVKAASWLHFLSADTVSMSCSKTLLFCVGFTNDHLSLQMSS